MAYLEMYGVLDRHALARNIFAATLGARGDPKELKKQMRRLQKD